MARRSGSTSSSSIQKTGSSSPSSINTTPSSFSNAAGTLSHSFGAFTPTAAVVASPSSSVRKPLHQTEVIVGAAIGGAAILGIIAGTIVLIGMRRIKSKPENQGLPQAAWKDGRDQNHGNGDTMIHSPFCELAAVESISELENSKESERPKPELEERRRPELESSNGPERPRPELENAEAFGRPMQKPWSLRTSRRP